jgi:hypothetical protein
MFKVKLLPNDEGFRNPHSSGIRFGYLGDPISFEFHEDETNEITIIEITILKDKNKATGAFEINEDEKRKIKLKYYNPSCPGTSGLSTPKAILVSGNRILALIFWIDIKEDLFTYRLTYEFYDEDIKLLKNKENKK